MIKKIFKLLTKQERKQLYMLFGAMVISVIIEVAGICFNFAFSVFDCKYRSYSEQ